MKMKVLAATAALMSASLPVMAQSGKATLADVLSATDVTISGRVDASYDWANTDGAPLFTGFQTEDNSFVLHQAAINIIKAPTTGVGGGATVLFGEDAKLLGGDSTDANIALLQGYASYTGTNYSVQLGRVLTLAGAEVIDSSANFNASRGLLFFFQPLYHTGLRGTYKLNGNLSFTAGVMNSVGIGNQDANTGNGEAKTVELNSVYTNGRYTGALTAYLGDEFEGQDAGFTRFIDYVGTFAFTPATTVALNADYVGVSTSEDDTFEIFGAALYGNHKFNTVSRVAARAEYVRGPDGIFGGDIPRNLYAGTLTYGHSVLEGLEVMAEVRGDFSASDDVYPTSDDNTQYSGTIKAVYRF